MKRLAFLLLTCSVLATSTSCSKDSDDAVAPTGPREYEVEYRVTSTASEANFIAYTNESGGTSTFNNVALPVTYKFKRTMRLGDNVTILAGIDGGTPASEVTCAILLDGREVKRETGRGASAQAVPVWVIGQ
ncbi:MAG TPA: hypothetical protein VK364_00370 [Hymenobacter sp.]|nr:hypothetical protein [Hymenobacter sp.]